MIGFRCACHGGRCRRRGRLDDEDLGLEQRLHLLGELLVGQLRNGLQVAERERQRAVEAQQNGHLKGAHRDRVGLFQVVEFDIS